mgnify:CR=1 FL=1
MRELTTGDEDRAEYGLEQHPETRAEGNLPFYPVRVDKFVVLSMLTLGIYELVWFYRNWRYVRTSSGDDIMPFWRTVFSALFYFNLIQRVRGNELGWGGALGLAYLLAQGANRLPDPFWVVESLTFLLLLPIVLVVNARVPRDQWPAASRWRPRSAALAAAAVLGLGFFVWNASLPPDMVATSEDVADADRDFLLESGILDPDEELLYFYSPGMIAKDEEGVLATDWGVTSYWLDPISEERRVGFISYTNIVNIEVNRAEDRGPLTIVRLTDVAGGWIVFVLSTRQNGDQAFIKEIERRSAVEPVPMTEI